MARWVRSVLLILGVLLIVSLYASFESYAIKSTFLAALYDVISSLVTEIWRFISTPTVFISVLVFALLWSFRARLDAMFPAIRKLTAGNVSAEFDYSQSRTPVEALIPSNPLVPVNARPNSRSSDVEATPDTITQASVVSFLRGPTCRVLLKADGKLLTVDEFIQIMDEEKAYERNIRNADKSEKFAFFLGAFRTLWMYVMPHLFSFETGDDLKVAHLHLKPGVRALIESRLADAEQYLE